MKVGELVAYMRVDDTQFNAGMSRGKSTLQGMANLAKSAGQVVATMFSAGTTVAAGLTTNLIKTGAAYNSLQQNSRAALSVMLGGAEKANAQMDKLDAWAKNSPFAKQVFIQAQQQLLGFGVAAEDIIPTLDAIQNAVASMGGGSAEIERVTYALAQMKSTGKLSGETLRDLGIMGIDAATIVGERMGKTGQEIRDMASKPGGIPVDEVWDPLVQGLAEKFGGATDLVKQQWTGATDRIKGAWRDIGSTIAKPFIDPNGGGKAVEWANLVADNLRGIEKHVKVAMPVIEKAMGSTFSRVEDILRKTNAGIAGFNLQGAIRQVKELTKYDPLIAATGASLFALGLKPIPVLNGLASGLMPLAIGIGALVARDPELRKMGSAFTEGLGSANTTVGDLVVQVANLAMELISEVGPGFVNAAQGAGELVGTCMDLASVLIEVLSAGAPVVGMAADLLGMFLNLPTPVLLTVSAFAAMKALGMGKTFTDIASGAKSGFGQIKTYAWAATQGTSGLGMVLSDAKGRALAFGSAIKGALVANAPLIAITALVSVLGAFAQASVNAKARADSYAEAVKEVGKASEKAAQEVAKTKFVTGENVDWGVFQKAVSGYDSVADAVEAAGISVEEFANAATGSSSEIAAMENRLLELANAGVINIGTHESLRAVLNQEANALQRAGHEQDQLSKSTHDGTAAAEANAAAMDRQREAAQGLIDAERNLAAAKGDLIQSQYAAKDALDQWKESMAEAGEIVRNSDGSIDKSSTSWRAFEQAFIDTARAQQTVIDNMVKAGASQQELDAKVAEANGILTEQASAFMGSADEAAAYNAELGLITPVVATTIDLRGADVSIARIEEVVNTANEATGYLTIDAKDDPAQQQLLESLGLVGSSEGVYTINAEDNPAIATLLASLGIVDTSTGTLTIDGNDKEAMDRLRNAVVEINRSDGTVKINGKDLTGPLREEVLRNINSIQGYARIYASDYASNTINRIRDKMAMLNGSTSTVYINSMSSDMGRTLKADGGYVEFYANGGRSENHIAQFAPAGTWRVWAEDETGGEWYIPQALSKRQRSLQIAAQMVDGFGYQMVPKSVQAFANGSPVSGPAAPAGASFSIGNVTITVPIEELEQIKDVVEFGETIRRKLMQQGVRV